MVSFLTSEDNFYGIKLKIILDCKNISVENLSWKIGIYTMTIYNYLNGKTIPNEKIQKRIIQFLNINPCYFFDDTEEKFLKIQKPIRGNYRSKIKQIYINLNTTLDDIQTKLDLKTRSFEYVVSKNKNPSLILLKKFVDILDVNPAFYYYDDASMFLNKKSIEERKETLAKLLNIKTKN